MDYPALLYDNSLFLIGFLIGVFFVNLLFKLFR